MQCNECGEDHDEVVFHAKCHIQSPTWVWFDEAHGIATVVCAECAAVVCYLVLQGVAIPDGDKDTKVIWQHHHVH